MDVDVEVTFEDAQSITTSNVQDLFEDSYVKGSVIQKLIIRVWNTKNAPELKHVMIILSSVGAEGVSVILTSDRQSSTATRAEVQNLIDARRQWYSRLFPSPGWLGLFQVIWYISVAVFSGMLMGLWMPGQVSIALWVALVSGLTMGTMGIYLMDAMFPRVLFEFGRSERRGASARTWRKTVGVTVILGLIIAVVGGILGELILERLRHF